MQVWPLLEDAACRAGSQPRRHPEEWMEAVPVKFVPRGLGETYRRDAWWVEPLVVFLVLGGFVVYATWAAFQNAHYTSGPYLSPFYSPVIFGEGEHAWFGPQPAWWPALLPFSPALLILPFPGLFRFTCYYYRGAYYKAFWADPIVVLGRRAARHALPRRELVSAGPAERPPLLRLHRRPLPVRADLRRVAGAVVPRPRPAARSSASGSARSSSRSTSCCSQLHARLPLDPAPRRAAARTRSRSPA